ncbi:hypothetical protein LJ737_20775 [Hymenobacter sp. 15J16-1T3B]|uniref:hypothetical protein n=1 Tax=Hymenobacter sp. 15J16-1T3B TaxID=2886941 RepID=UPI001D113F19|nr:hypothetical protein [Hymenobacter sp. 15J16-1T3B]MCC3159688.1 hypothetical protein [Hymenobacter sp. 15J16-1T3B]
MRHTPMRRRALRYRYPKPAVHVDYTPSGKLVLDLNGVLAQLELREMLQELKLKGNI